RDATRDRRRAIGRLSIHLSKSTGSLWCGPRLPVYAAEPAAPQSPTPSPSYLLPNIPTAATKFRSPLHNPRAGQNFGEFFLKSVTQKTGPRETGPMLFLRRP